jgi:hypothetical protein
MGLSYHEKNIFSPDRHFSIFGITIWRREIFFMVQKTHFSRSVSSSEIGQWTGMQQCNVDWYWFAQFTICERRGRKYAYAYNKILEKHKFWIYEVYGRERWIWKIEIEPTHNDVAEKRKKSAREWERKEETSWANGPSYSGVTTRYIWSILPKIFPIANLLP